MEFKKHVLKNGLRVVLAPMKDTETVTVQILIEAGSKYEKKSNNGISHFLEHMMFKGTKKRPHAKNISEELDSIGGEYNAFTSKEQTGYWVKVPQQHFDLALDVVSDLYLNSLLEQKEINKERGVILQEAAMYRDTPIRYVWDIFENLLYGDQPAGWDIIGTENNIRNFNRKDFVDYLKNNYLPKNTVIVIAGKFDEKTGLEKVEKIFNGSRKKQKKSGKKKTIEKQFSPQVNIFYKETDQTHLILGVRSCDMFHKNRFATVLLGTILGGGMSSRMFLNIREKYGLTYYINSASEQMTDSGYLFASAGVEHKNLKKAIALILKEFKKITTRKVTKKELKKAKEYLKGKMLMSLESSSAQASFFGDQELFKGKIDMPEILFSKIDKVGQDDIIKTAKNIFANKGLNLALIGPHKNLEELKNMLKL
jgi:predicted Zn-dependent peptidase